MKTQKTPFERLVAARPPIMDQPVVDADRVLDGIVAAAAVPEPSRPRRRVSGRLVAAGGLAAVLVAAGVVVATQQGERPPPAAVAQPDYRLVVANVQKALTEKDFVLRQTSVHPTREGTKVESTTWSDAATDRQRTVTSVNGGRITSIVDTGPASARQVTVVSYPDRAWWRHTYSKETAQPQPSGTPLKELIPLPSTPDQIRAALSAGEVRVDPGQTPTINGHRTVQLSTRASEMVGPMKIWVDARTYLPVRISGSSTGSIKFVGSDLEWLPRTPANLAKLDQPIPAGFRYSPKPITQAPPAKGGVG